MRDSSRNESPRSLDQQGRGERQDNNGSEQSSSFDPRIAEEAMEWFKAHPRRRCYARRALPGEWPGGATHTVFRRDPVSRGGWALSSWALTVPVFHWEGFERAGEEYLRGLCHNMFDPEPLPLVPARVPDPPRGMLFATFGLPGRKK